MNDIDENRYRIARLECQPGDIVVLKLDRPWPMEAMERMKYDLQTILPDGVRCILLDPHVELSVLTRKQIEDMK